MDADHSRRQAADPGTIFWKRRSRSREGHDLPVRSCDETPRIRQTEGIGLNPQKVIDGIQVASGAVCSVEVGRPVYGDVYSAPCFGLELAIVVRKAFLGTRVTAVRAGMAELLPTVSALERLLAGVNPGVLLEMVLVLEGLLADIADVLSRLLRFLVTDD